MENCTVKKLNIKSLISLSHLCCSEVPFMYNLAHNLYVVCISNVWQISTIRSADHLSYLFHTACDLVKFWPKHNCGNIVIIDFYWFIKQGLPVLNVLAGKGRRDLAIKSIIVERRGLCILLFFIL